MSGSPHLQAPPGMATVYRATLDALAMYGPRRVGVTHIARLAGTNRPFLYRNWASPRVLLRDATLHELTRLLDTAREVPGPLPPPRCCAVRVVVRAARLLREHPVVGAMARTEPALTYAAILCLTTVWHQKAWHWLGEHVTGHLPRGSEQDTVTLSVLTAAMPYALIPSQSSPDPAVERAAIDRRLSQVVHACLGLPPACSDCAAAGTPCPGGGPGSPTAAPPPRFSP
ncbi:TetR/AcrR family transcriptional regulator [Streptomyces sp. NBC_01396]|uniref:TetR/AcrR family transcriptional regulator n=1 Tax=Streptomyces sp. NBC_01396 TaxID=2903852 RepID=UPI0032459BEA